MLDNSQELTISQELANLKTVPDPIQSDKNHKKIRNFKYVKEAHTCFQLCTVSKIGHTISTLLRSELLFKTNFLHSLSSENFLHPSIQSKAKSCLRYCLLHSENNELQNSILNIFNSSLLSAPMNYRLKLFSSFENSFSLQKREREKNQLFFCFGGFKTLFLISLYLICVYNESDKDMQV